MSNDARKNVPIRADLHKQASEVAKARGGIKLQIIGDWAFEAWLAKNTPQPKKAGGK